ncbi:MAG: UDP-N-acetylmuramoyl-L-alanine--D-glutamate ligase [Acidobacteria bacterium]|nr:UDP-N-acetylmuramoyl-L-alanine--D-glutamate ligase [Acidobacteriota bacterium]
MSYRGKSVLVAGAGRSGVAAARFLLSRGARVTLTDIRPRESLEPAVGGLEELAARSGELALELGGHREESFRRSDLVVVSPGIPLSLPLFDASRAAGVPVIAEVELAYRHIEGTLIGITGSNGKTTTTALVAHLASAAGRRCRAAGNIGTPLIRYAEDSAPGDLYAVELSSFQLEAIDTFRPAIGAILNLTPDHLDRYAGFGEYVAAKQRLFMNQVDGDRAVLNADDARTAAMAAAVHSRPVLFSRRRSLERGAFVRGGRVLYRSDDGERDLFPVEAVGLVGAHNLENVLAACAMAILAGIPAEGLEAGVRAFRGVEHRIELVAELDGVRYYNDSKATNVDATAKALESFPGNILLIAGGRDKEGDFASLRPLVRQRVRRLVVIGEAADKLRRALADVTAVSAAGSMEEAVSACRREAGPGDVVLLAPACASFDMFRDYEERGRAFKEAVLAPHRGEEAGRRPGPCEEGFHGL